MENKIKRKIKCSKCNYEWETKSILAKISCPSCLYKVKNIYHIKKEENGKNIIH